MNGVASQLLTAVLALSERERAEVAAQLIDSLDPGVDDNATACWDREIQRRAAELDAGQVNTIPWAEARRKIVGGDDAELAH